MSALSAKHARTLPLSIKAKTAIACTAVATLAVSGAALAYLTDTDSVNNRFNVVSALDIEIVEETWDSHTDSNADGIPDIADAVVPAQAIAKDPAIRNNDGGSAWVFMEATVPTRTVSVVNRSGEIEDPELTKLFNYDMKPGWKMIERDVPGEDSQTSTSLFAWEEPLEPGETTTPLFDEVVFANLADGQLGGEGGSATELSVDITAYGIQSNGFDTYEEAWEAFAAQTASSDQTSSN